MDLRENANPPAFIGYDDQTKASAQTAPLSTAAGRAYCLAVTSSQLIGDVGRYLVAGYFNLHLEFF